MKRKLAILSLALTIPMLAAVGVLARRDHAAPAITTATVSRGDIVSTIAAIGTVEPVTTVEVGSQVTGIIQSLRTSGNSSCSNCRQASVLFTATATSYPHFCK